MSHKWYEDEPGRVLLRVISAYTRVRGFHALLIQKESMVGELHAGGHMVLFPGFRWDGASGPSLDSPQNLRPSAFHDAGYLMIEQGVLPMGCRRAIDLSFYDQLRPTPPKTVLGFLLFPFREVRALYHYVAVRLFGALWLRKCEAPS